MRCGWLVRTGIASKLRDLLPYPSLNALISRSCKRSRSRRVRRTANTTTCLYWTHSGSLWRYTWTSLNWTDSTLPHRASWATGMTRIAWFEPPVGVLEEERFKSLTRAVAVGGVIVRRVDERAREGLNLAFHVKAVAVNDLIEPLPGFFRPVGVQLNFTALAPGPLCNDGESLAFTRTRVKCGEIR